MSDRNSSPFRHALSRSKSFLSSLKSTTTKPKPKPKPDDNNTATRNDTVPIDTTTTTPNPNYKRRMRVIPAAERAENPLNLGERGWGAQSWSHVQQERRQRAALEELWSETGSLRRGLDAERPAAARESRAGSYARREEPSTQEDRGSKGGSSPREERHVSSGSAALYRRALPLRALEVSGSPGRVGARETGGGVGMQAHRTRVSGPKPDNTHSKSGGYMAQGVRVTPGSYGDREREEYLARLRAGGGSRAGDGTRRAAGGTLF